MNEADVIGYVLLALLVLATFIAICVQQEELEDPENTEVVYLHQLDEVSKMDEQGRFLLRTFRQSGNLQKNDQYFDSASSAIRAAVKTFNRAKIEYAVIVENTKEEFSFRRPYHCHRGSQEGKKVGSISIIRCS